MQASSNNISNVASNEGQWKSIIMKAYEIMKAMSMKASSEKVSMNNWNMKNA